MKVQTMDRRIIRKNRRFTFETDQGNDGFF